MACCLTFFLLCSGLIDSLYSQESPAAASPTNTSLTPTTVSTNKTADPQTNTTSNKLSPTNNQSSTTVVPSNTAKNTSQPTQPESTSPPPLQCSYTISTIRFGFKVVIMNSFFGSYILTLTESVSGTVLNESLQHSDQTSSHDITPLKPCTEYSHSLVFTDSNTKCKPVGNRDTVRTSEMKEDDIVDGNCTSLPKHVCYKSNWDISSSVSASSNVTAERCPVDPNVFCIKPGNDDICTNLTTTFTSGNCSSFSRIKDISFDYFEIKPTPPNRLPANINASFPPNCKGLTIEYTCQDSYPSNEGVKLQDLEPFTEYSCTGQINQNNQNIKNITVPKFIIDCDLITFSGVIDHTDTFIELDWISYSDNCDVYYLTKFDKLMYECHCKSTKGERYSHHSPPNGCLVDGLEPDADYRCAVQPFYAGIPVGTPSIARRRTEIGTPEKVTGVSVSHPQHNEITVICDDKVKFNGPRKHFTATVLYDGKPAQQPQYNTSGCYFTFKDLSYSTTYTLKVRAVNSERGGPEWTQEVTTLYDDKALIGFLITLIILGIGFSVIYAICVKKKMSQKTRNNDLKLESTAIYVNVPRS